MRFAVAAFTGLACLVLGCSSGKSDTGKSAGAGASNGGASSGGTSSGSGGAGSTVDCGTNPRPGDACATNGTCAANTACYCLSSSVSCTAATGGSGNGTGGTTGAGGNGTGTVNCGANPRTGDRCNGGPGACPTDANCTCSTGFRGFVTCGRGMGGAGGAASTVNCGTNPQTNGTCTGGPGMCPNMARCYCSGQGRLFCG